MSATPYLEVAAGATPFTGTTAATVFAAPIADLSDFDTADRFRIRHTALYLNNTGDVQELRYDLYGDATLLHSLQFGSVGPDNDPCDVVIDYEIVVTAGNTCRVLCEAWMSTAGTEAARGNGPARRPRPTVWRAKAFVEPVTLDLRATVQTADIALHLLSPDETFVHKVEPVLSAGVGGGAVTSVQGETGVVVLTAADVGAAAEDQIGAPVVRYNRSGPNTGKYDARPTTPVAVYEGPVEPTVANCLSPAFTSGADFWWKTPS